MDDLEQDREIARRIEAKIGEVFSHLGVGRGDWSFQPIVAADYVIVRQVNSNFARDTGGVFCCVKVKIEGVSREMKIQGHGAGALVDFGNIVFRPDVALEQSCKDLLTWLGSQGPG